MSPEEAAEALREEIEEELAGVGSVPGRRVRSVEPPADLGADTVFRVTVIGERGPGSIALPTGLVMAYLADEEAAVDEFKRRLQALQRPGADLDQGLG